MNITEITKTWQIGVRTLTNLKTGEVRTTDYADSHYLAAIGLKKFLSECEFAFHSGHWQHRDRRDRH